MVDLRSKLLRRLDDLPVLPGVVTQLLALDHGADDHADRVSELIEAEPNFSARLLAYANSAASAPASPIVTLPAAVTRVGSIGATGLVLALGVTTVFVPRDEWDSSLWRHSIQVAIAARALAVAAGPPDLVPEAAYAAGLLHDIGRFVMFQHAPSELRLVDEGDWSTPGGLVAEETRICSIDHAELGALACERWGIPEVIVETVRCHHRPVEGLPTSNIECMTHLVAIADRLMFPSAAPGTLRPTSEEVAARVAPLMPGWMRLDEQVLADLIDRVVADEQRLSALVGLRA